MRKLLFIFLILCTSIFAQDVDTTGSLPGALMAQDVDGDCPDIFTPGNLPLFMQLAPPIDIDEALPDYSTTVDMILFVLPNCIIYFAVDPDIDGTDIWTPLPTGNGGGGGMSPPPCGYKGVTSPPTDSGCEYVTFNGTDKDGNEFSITAQVYIYKDTATKDKAKKISDELNNQSDNTTNDPVVSSAAKGTFTVQPAAGGEITSAEWDNGSAEEDNELIELSYEKKQTCGTRAKGNPTGITSSGDTSHIMIGFGRFKIRTFVQLNESTTTIMQRLKEGLLFLGIKSKMGYDAEGDCWLIWDNPYRKSRFGSNDLGLSHMIVSDRAAPSVKETLSTMKVGRYEVFLEH